VVCTDLSESHSMSRIRRYLEIKEVLAPFFNERERKKISFAIIANTFLSLLDIIGVALIGIIAALSVRGVQSSAPGSRVESVLKLLHLDGVSLQFSVSVLGLTAALAFLTRTAVSAILTRKMLEFLGRKSADISKMVADRVIGLNIQIVEKKPQSEVLYALTTGAVSLTLGVTGSAITLISELILVVLLLSLLIVFSPSVAIPTTIIFIITGLFLNRMMHKKAYSLGIERSDLIVRSNTEILDALLIQRNIHTSDLSEYYAEKVRLNRVAVSKNLASTEFMPYVTKYVIEVVLVVFSFALAASQFILKDAAQAVATLSLFMAAGMRIAPAVMRIQQASVQFVGSLANSSSTLEVLNTLITEDGFNKATDNDFSLPVKKTLIQCENLSFSYLGNSFPTLKNIDLKLETGQVMAIVGPSGSGKSTLADLILGVLQPTAGHVLINGVPPGTLITSDPTALGYVPQKTHLIAGTILENVFMRSQPEVDLDLFWETMEIVDLKSFVLALPQRENTFIGDGGLKLSGGQTQRVGIARAFIKNPKLVILDEATSALDAQVEAQISAAVSIMRNKGVSILIIAHRLSTVRNADEILYLDRGSVLSRGDFESVRRDVPDFNEQAKLMGL
jgi:ABC-type multidrug transport system fused ATPase/permease subunit